MHRDIKPSNIFLTKENTVKLGDFGVSKFFKQEHNNTRVGTPLYLAPEIVQNKNYNFKSDIWSTGCVIYYITALKVPFKA